MADNQSSETEVQNQDNAIYSKFQGDKEAVLDITTEYLKIDPELDGTIDFKNIQANLRKAANQAITDGDFTAGLKKLEALRDAKTNILTYVENGTLIRDARSAKDPRVLSSEAFEMQYLNAIRAAIDLVEQDPQFIGKENEQKKDDAIKAMTSNVASAMTAIQKPDLDQKQCAKNFKKEITKLGSLLEKQGVKKPFKKLNIAKDFQNFKDEHKNIVTISSIVDKNGKQRNVVEAEVAFKELTADQKKDYQAIIDAKDTPKWFQKLKPWEQKLVENNAQAIIEGNHVIPTQLRQIVGMKNAFEKITAVMNGQELEILHTSKHAGTLTSLAKDKKSRQDITNENAKQAQAWMGSEKQIHCNTLNSLNGAGNDHEIVTRTANAMKDVGGNETNTAFNQFRYLGRSHDFSGVKNVLGKLKVLSTENITDIKEKERGKIAQLQQSIEKLTNSEKKANRWFKYPDSENSSLAVSTALNQVTNDISKLSPDTREALNLPQEEILTMCASGKDRTGLAEHDQSAQALQAYL
ncbi:MAG: hypothetical protein P8P83_03270 [Rickettsiaceae bacterium]|nr:hypothetical protein [Rickettsiaceae bacterium]